jgi:hypothetical protein
MPSSGSGKKRNCAPVSEEAQAAIGEWYQFLNSNKGHYYSLEAFQGLGQLTPVN